jgi:PRTRC genetic system protein C
MSKVLPRVFVLSGKEPLPDPAPSLSVEEVRGLLAKTYPELTNAKFTEKIEDGKIVIRFEASYGTKG